MTLAVGCGPSILASILESKVTKRSVTGQIYCTFSVLLYLATCMPSTSSPQRAACVTFSKDLAASPGPRTRADKWEVTLL